MHRFSLFLLQLLFETLSAGGNEFFQVFLVRFLLLSIFLQNILEEGHILLPNVIKKSTSLGALHCHLPNDFIHGTPINDVQQLRVTDSGIFIFLVIFIASR